MKKLLLLSILILAFAFAANAQKVEIEQATADKCAKCFIESKAKDEVIEAKNRELTAAGNETAAAKVESAAKDAIIKIQAEENAALRKIKCSEFSLLKIGAFKLFHKKTCY